MKSRGEYVWLVTFVELGQAGSVRGVFHSADAAKLFVAVEFPEFRFDLEQPENYFQWHHWLGSDSIKVAAWLVH